MRIYIVEDSDLVLGTLKHMLAGLPGVRVVGNAATEEAAVTGILKHRPDLALLDLALAAGSGLNVLRRVRAAGCGARALVLSNHADGPYREACLAAGAEAVYDKVRDAQAMLDQLRAWLPPQPTNEGKRLQALRRLKILDTPQEEVFDEITRLAARLLEVPVALISLVDENRQWFKSRVGIAATETSRAVSFCGHAINQAELFVVEDASRDPRFADNPLVRGPEQVRFYAGMPLVLPGGEAIGTLCVIDQEPRSLGEVQRQALTVLARQVVTELELRGRVAELEQEVERRRAAEVRIMHLATRDPLTGLPNRAALMDRLSQAIKVAQRDAHPMAFMFLDLDRFKLINDSLGHQVGDALLQQVGERLATLLRDSDTVARLGGDEFAVVLPRLEGLEDACRVAEKIIAAVNAPMTLQGRELRVDCSVGVAIYPEHGRGDEALVRHADLAMYHAKASGSNQYRVYAAEMNAAAVERLTLECDLRQALIRREFVLHYQPQIGLQGEGVSGVEALVRWVHPEHGLVPPMKFIPLAEETGLIWDLGRYVIDEALRQMAVWLPRRDCPPRMAVNVSPAQLRPELADLLRAAGRAHGVPLDRVEVEITESALASDGPQVLELLANLRGLGVSIAVDDFGVGYSSLALLRRLPLNTLKIDRAFVDEVAFNHQDATIVQSILSMGRGLNLRVVAEGVEDDQQRVALRVMGCDDAQGYHYSRPLPADEFAAWMASRVSDRPANALGFG